MYTCPICYFTGMQDPPRDYNICECCGTEFGNDDEAHSHEELRTRWIEGGAKWFFRSAPVGWNPWTQLFMANVGPLRYNGIPRIYGGTVLAAAETIYDANEMALPYHGTVTIYAGAVLGTAETIYDANEMALPHYGAVRMDGGPLRGVGTAIHAANVAAPPCGGASTISGGAVPDAAAMIYAARDVFAYAA